MAVMRKGLGQFLPRRCHRKLPVLDALSADKAVCHGSDLAAFAFHDQDLDAVVMIKMHVHGGENQLVEVMLDAGAISPEDLDLFQIVDTPEEGFRVLRDGLTQYHLTTQPAKAGAPEIAKTNP